MLRKLIGLGFIVLLTVASCYGVLVWQNNRSVPAPTSEEIAASREKSVAWLLAHRSEVLQDGNPILWWMLGQSAKITGDDRLQALYADFRAKNDSVNKDSVWQTFFEPEHYWGANFSQSAYSSYADYQQYFLFGLTCSKQLSDEPLINAQNNPGFCAKTHPLSPACTTHQLMGLRFLQRSGCDRVEQLDSKIGVLQNSIENQLTWDPRVVDVYIQRVLMLVDSGAAQKVKPRWLQRVLNAQLADGSWSNLQPLFAVGGERFFGFDEKLLGVGRYQGTLHATAQGVWLMSLLQHENNSADREEISAP